MKKISIIVAVGNNWVIGKKNGLPWHLPADLKHFKELTLGHIIIMGRKTYDSIGRPLPNRTSIIISRRNLNIPGCTTVKSTEEALGTVPDNQEVFIIGGSEIYSQFLPLAQKLYITRVYNDFDGDIFFPKINLSEWNQILKQDHGADEKNIYNYSFIIYEK